MAAIISFIGWHNSGKTSLATGVVAELKALGYRVAVIKSTSESGIVFDTPGTDTSKHKEAGADSVMLVAPDQLVLQSANAGLSLMSLAHRYYADMDIVIGEGFKYERKIPKIEVFSSLEQRLRDEVHGVVAVATNLKGIAEDYVFRLDEAKEIAHFIEKRYLLQGAAREEITSLLVNGHKVPLKEFIQESLAGTVYGFVKTLKLVKSIEEIELRIRLKKEGSS